MKNTLYYGDNLDILREYIPSESVDLIYLDPPFNSKRTYNVLFKHEDGQDSQAQMAAFEDTWHWNIEAERTYHELVTEAPDNVAQMIAALRQFIGTNQMLAYLVMMAIRLVELHRVLKLTGSLYLHCDPTASHYLKIVLDAIFGADKFVNEIIWKRTGAHTHANRFAPNSDTILFYSKSTDFIWNPQFIDHSEEYINSKYRHNDNDGRGQYTLDNLTAVGVRPNLMYEWKGHESPARGWRYSFEKMTELDANGYIWYPDSKSKRPRRKRYLKDIKGKALDTIWTDIFPLNSQAKERLGYPTQKPVELLKRIVEASSNKGDIVLDPICGCGTTISAAQELGRTWIGIDVTFLATSLIKYRLKDQFPDAQYKVVGEPTTLAAAKHLALQDRFQFEWWALPLVGARPIGGESGSKKGKKGADQGVDGFINFIDDASGKPKRIIVQVKSGKVNSATIRDLGGTTQREKAAIGILITLNRPTKPMQREAASAGFYHSSGWNQDYPKIQILTVEQLLDGKLPDMPPNKVTFAKAVKVQKKTKQKQLGLGI